MKCPTCKGGMEQIEQDYVVELPNGEEVRLEGVPAWFCERCDTTLVEDDVIEAIDDMLEHWDTLTVDGGEEE